MQITTIIRILIGIRNKIKKPISIYTYSCSCVEKGSFVFVRFNRHLVLLNVSLCLAYCLCLETIILSFNISCSSSSSPHEFLLICQCVHIYSYTYINKLHHSKIAHLPCASFFLFQMIINFYLNYLSCKKP